MPVTTSLADDKNKADIPLLTTVMAESWRHLDGNGLLTLNPSSNNDHDVGIIIDKTRHMSYENADGSNTAAQFKHLESAVGKLEKDQDEFVSHFEKDFEMKIEQLRTDVVQIIEKEHKMQRDALLHKDH